MRQVEWKLGPFNSGKGLMMRSGFSSTPTTPAGIQVSLRAPQASLARQALELERSIHDMQLRIDAAHSGAQRRPERAVVRRLVEDALRNNLAILKVLRTALMPMISAEAILTAAVTAKGSCSSYPADRLFSLLRRDWSFFSECESEIGTLLGALMSQLESRLSKNANVLVLGAGVGRLAHELAARYKNVYAIELSAPLLICAAQLRQGPIHAYEVSTRHTRTGEDQAKPFTARWPQKPGPAAKLCLMDATDLPFADGWADAVVSVYFTDVVPPRKLLPEVRRVLRPGGRFVHLGPLGYHFDDPDDHLSAAELLQEVAAHGFNVGKPRWVTSTHECDADSIYECRFHNLLFTGDAVAGEKFVPYVLPRFPFL